MSLRDNAIVAYAETKVMEKDHEQEQRHHENTRTHGR